MLKNTLFSKVVGVATLYAFSSTVLAQSAYANRGLPPISFDEMYSLAQKGEVEALRASVFRGLDIDTLNSSGDTGLCVAARRHDVYTYNSFRASGANPRHPCTQKISDYENFLEKSRVVGVDGTSREALSAMGNKETYKMNNKIWWWIGGILLAGGATWWILDHHHHHGHDDNNGGGSSGGSELYYSLGANAYSQGSAIKTTTGNSENTEILSYSNEDLKNLEIIDLRKTVLQNTNQIKSALYAGDGGTFINKNDVLIDLGEGAIGMNAVKNSNIINKGYIRIDSYNASVGMVASESSRAENHGTGIIANSTAANGINMNFSGYADNATIVGMYADTNSQLANYGDIYGTAIKSAQKTQTTTKQNSSSSSGLLSFADESDDEKEKDTTSTSSIGTMIGMEAMILNVGSKLKENVVTAVNDETGSIYLSAGDSGTTTTEITVELIGMGSYLDDAFLNSSNILSRAEQVNLINDGTINLSYSGNYSASSSTALRKGLGGIVGIRADANSQAYNNGSVDIILYDEFQNEGVDVAAGLQSVHGGDLINSGKIRIYTPSENKRINYGMLAVEGSGTNSSLYANINPLLKNTSSGKLDIQVSNSFGMASFIGGEVINEGDITIGSKETRFNNNIAMYGYGKTKQAELKNTGTINLYSYKSIAMQNDYAGGTDITNDGIINIYESSVDSYVFGGAYSNLYNKNTINYSATSSKQENRAAPGVIYNPFMNYTISIGTSIISTKTRSIKEDTVDFESSTTEAIYNEKNANINMKGSSFVSAMSVETNDNAESTQAKAYNKGTITIEDRATMNATNAVGMYVDSGSLNNAGIYNEGEIITDSQFSAAMASNSLKNADVVNTGTITANKEASLGIYISDVSNVINNGKMYLYESNSVGIQAGHAATESGTQVTSFVYPKILIGEDGEITIGSTIEYVENSYGIFVDALATNTGMGAQVENNGTIYLYTKTAGGAIFSNSNNAQIENKKKIHVFGDNAYGIYSGGNATIINSKGGNIEVGRKDIKKGVKDSYAIYNTGESNITNKGSIDLCNNEEAYAVYSTGKSDIVNEGEINLLSEKGTAIYAEHGTVSNKHNINLDYDYNTAIELSGDATATNEYGVAAADGTINKITINVGSVDNAISHGCGIKTTNPTGASVVNKGIINLFNDVDSYAILASGVTNVTNSDTGNINSANDYSTAILATGTVSVKNDGNINVKGVQAYAIKGAGEASVLSVENNNIITAGENTSAPEGDTGAAIYAATIDNIINNGTLQVYNLNGYGIYADAGQNNDQIINNNIIEMHNASATGIYSGAVNTVINDGEINTSSATSKGIEAYTTSEGSTPTITNRKKININNAKGSFGIYSSTAININNTKDAEIIVGNDSVLPYDGNGVYAPNAVNINNAGKIFVYANNAKGIYGNGSITNSGTIDIKGSNSYGIYAPTATQITNSGDVFVDDGYGIFTAGTVTNQQTGRIYVTGGSGIAVKNASSLDNYGEIESHSQTAVISGVASVTNHQGASITNTNSKGFGISNTSNVVNDGSITSFSDGINNSGSLTVENNGSITVYGSSDSDGSGIYNTGSLNVINNGSIWVKTGGGNGITSFLANSTNTAYIENNNNIDVEGSGNGIFVYVPTNETEVTIMNNGTISVVAGKGIYIKKGYSFVPIYDEEDPSKIVGYNPDSEALSIINSQASLGSECDGGGLCWLPDAISTTSVDKPVAPLSDDDITESSLIATNDSSALGNVTLVNRGTITTSGNVDFGTQSADSAKISIGEGGSYKADSFVGTVAADTSIVDGGFATTYVNEDSFVGENKGIEVVSQSYMFDAVTQENEKGNTDVIMTMKPFEDVVEDKDLAAYLSENYQNQKAEQVFNLLKSAESESAFNGILDKEMGFDLIPNFIKQDLDVERNISTEINDNLLNLEGPDTRYMFDITAYKNNVKSKDTTTGYKDRVVAAHGFTDTVLEDDIRAGLGLAVIRADSEYDSDASRYNNTAAIFIPVIFDEKYFTGLIKPKAGFSRGHYRRASTTDNHKADTDEYFYGADFAIGKDIDVSTLKIKPVVGFNLTNLHTGKINENNHGLNIKNENVISALSVLGIDAEKKFLINNKSDVVLGVGGKYFHEFGDRYDNRGNFEDTVSYFKIPTNRFNRDFGVLKLKAGYNFGQANIEAGVSVPLEDKQKPYFTLNAKYMF